MEGFLSHAYKTAAMCLQLPDAYGQVHDAMTRLLIHIDMDAIIFRLRATALGHDAIPVHNGPLYAALLIILYAALEDPGLEELLYVGLF